MSVPVAAFAALGDATWCAIRARLTYGPATAGQLSGPAPISRPATSQHAWAGAPSRQTKAGRPRYDAARDWSVGDPHGRHAARRPGAAPWLLRDGLRGRLAEPLSERDDVRLGRRP